MHIVIIDYGLGNVGSLLNMCKKIGVFTSVSSEVSCLEIASHLILPGVGAFDTGMKNLHTLKLTSILDEIVKGKKTPILGICLGAQLMLKASEEGKQTGLGWLDGSVVRFNNGQGVKVPHMGWNTLSRIHNFTLFDEMPEYPPRFYFVHSYHFRLDHTEDVTSECNYGSSFPASFQKENIFGVQFHPEKSHLFGTRLLTNFFKLK